LAKDYSLARKIYLGGCEADVVKLFRGDGLEGVATPVRFATGLRPTGLAEEKRVRKVGQARKSNREPGGSVRKLTATPDLEPDGLTSSSQTLSLRSGPVS
jgi:hypothetical protein